MNGHTLKFISSNPFSNKASFIYYFLTTNHIKIKLVYCLAFMLKYSINANKCYLFRFDMYFYFVC